MFPRTLLLVVLLTLTACECHCADELAKGTPTPTPSASPSAASTTELNRWVKFAADIGTVIIATCALVVTLNEAKHTQRRDRLIVKPLLVFGRYYPRKPQADDKAQEPAPGLHIVNSGLGPAMIKSTVFHSKSRNLSTSSIETIMSFIGDFGFVKGETQCLFYFPGDVISAGKSSRYVILQPPGYAKADLFNILLDDIDIVISYASIYDEASSCSSRKSTVSDANNLAPS